MAKNVKVAGAAYSDVPAIDIPLTSGGTARFYDCVGSETITQNGEVDVKGLESVVVNVPSVEPTYDTPSITVSTGGLITASANGKSNTKQLTTKVGTTITPTKSQQTAISSQTYATGNILVGAIPSNYIVPSGSKTLTENITYDVTSLSSVTVNVPTSGGGKNVQCYQGYATVTSTSYTATSVSLTVAVTGTYDISWIGFRNTNSGTSGSQLYIGNTAYGSAQTTFVNTYGQSVTLKNVSLTAGQTITVRARARSTSYVMGVGNLCIVQN